jgi:hypothetical protein
MKRFIVGFLIFIGVFNLVTLFWVLPFILFSLNPDIRGSSPFPDSWHEYGITNWQYFPTPIYWISISAFILAYLLAARYIYKKGLKK